MSVWTMIIFPANRPDGIEPEPWRDAERPDHVLPLRVDRLAAHRELVPHLEVGVHLVAVVGLEGEVHRVVDQHLVAGGELAEPLEVRLADAGDDDVALARRRRT